MKYSDSLKDLVGKRVVVDSPNHGGDGVVSDLSKDGVLVIFDEGGVPLIPWADVGKIEEIKTEKGERHGRADSAERHEKVG